MRPAVHLCLVWDTATANVTPALDPQFGPGETSGRGFLPTAVGVVGAARSELIEAADLVDCAVGWMARHLV